MDADDLEWNDVAAFLAIAEAGSLSGAARATGASQPTMGRHLRQIEARLGRELFFRQPRGLALTEAGQELLVPARRMAEAMKRFSLTAAGQDARPSGTVRITASAMVAHHMLPPIIADMRRDHPEIEIELLPSDSSKNLLFREADIAVRMFPTTQLDVITRRLGAVPIGMFAAKDYLDRRGRPDTPEALFAHDLVGYDRDERIIEGMRAAGWQVSRNDFGTRCDDQLTYWELVRAGCGIGLGQRGIGRADPRLEEVMPELPIEPLPIWLAAAEATRHTPRVAAVWDMLAQGITGVLAKG